MDAELWLDGGVDAEFQTQVRGLSFPIMMSL